MFASAEFWVAVAFVIFWGILFYYGVPRRIVSALDSRGKRVADELAEARRLRADAEALLREFEAKRAAAELRAAAVDAAVRASEQVLRGELSGPAAETLVTSSLGDVSRKLNG